MQNTVIQYFALLFSANFIKSATLGNATRENFYYVVIILLIIVVIELFTNNL